MNRVRGAAGGFEERRMESTRENPGYMERIVTSLPSCHLLKLKEENLNVILSLLMVTNNHGLHNGLQSYKIVFLKVKKYI